MRESSLITTKPSLQNYTKQNYSKIFIIMKRFTILFFLCVMSIPLLHAQKQVSGTVYSSQLPDYAEVVLTGDTKIVVNMDRMIRYIKGDYNLTIEDNGGYYLASHGAKNSEMNTF